MYRHTIIAKRGALMEREQVLQLLVQHKPQLAQRYGVLRLALFGSTARDSTNADIPEQCLEVFP